MAKIFVNGEVLNAEDLNDSFNSKAELEHSHTKDQIEDFPSSMPASDVPSWAKEPTKPSYTKSDVGLGNVTNDAQVKRTEMGSNNGVATLGSDGKIPAAQLPSYVDDVISYNSESSFPASGEDGKIYIAKDTNKTYRWSGSSYVEISESLALGETASTAYAGNKGKANADAIANHKDDKNNPHGVTKSQVGLGNCDNTADADKNVLTAKYFDTYEADGSSSSSNTQCLQTFFNDCPKSKGTAVRLQHGSHSMAFGWFLSGYDYSRAYGGWFISDYATPSWVGVSNGSWCEYQFITSGNIGSQSVSYASSAGNADTVDGHHLDQDVLTTSSPTFANITSNGSGRFLGNVIIGTNNDSTEGGQITLVAAKGYANQQIDSYQNCVRIFKDGKESFNFDCESLKTTLPGDVYAAGTLSCGVASDARLKENIEDVDCVKEIESLGGVKSFKYIDDEKHLKTLSGKNSIGLIAQNVQKSEHLADLVKDKEDGFLGVDYYDPRLISLALGAIQQLSKKNEELKAQIDELKRRLS